MTRQVRHGGWAIAGSFVVAFMLVTLPLPDWARAWRPEWVTLTLIYWCLATPQRVGMGTAWSLGLLMDVLTGSLLGQQALSMTLVAYVAHKFYLQVRVRPVWQQGLTVFVLVISAKLVGVWVKGISGLPTYQDAVLWPSLSSTLLWPWIFIVLRDLRRKYKVA